MIGALVVGRFLRRADEQGTPVRFRDGPAAVTERKRSVQSLFGHCREFCDEKAGLAGEPVRGFPARESEDLPTLDMWFSARDGNRQDLGL